MKWPSKRREESRALQEWVQSQPVMYTTKTFVRSRSERLGNNWANRYTWVSWNNRHSDVPRLVVRTRGIEVSAPQGMLLERRSFFFSAEAATMWRDRIGWAGTPLGRRDCIRLRFDDPIELALTPDSGVEEAWQALVNAGVRPVTGRD